MGANIKEMMKAVSLLLNIKPLFQSKYKEIISNLPTKNDWKLMPIHQYQDFWYFTPYLEAVLAAQEKFQAQPNDIIISNFPKTGITWLKALAFAIITRSRYPISESPLLTSTPHDCVPFFEVDAANNENNRNPEIPLAATHLPYNSLPSSIMENNCKIVYICRDPKDVLVSMWHFLRHKVPKGFRTFFKINDSFELFCEGIINNGPYWDHVLGYWKASQESPDKVLFLVYEDMRMNTLCNVKKLAEFLGHPFTNEEEKNGKIEEIINLCSFENLKDLRVSKNGAYSSNVFCIKNSSFYREGNIGGWKNYITEEMGARLDLIVEQKLSGSGFSFTSI